MSDLEDARENQSGRTGRTGRTGEPGEGGGRGLELLVNGEPRSVAAGCTVEALVRELGLERRRIAVAVNRDVVPRSGYDVQLLAAGDRVEILEAVGGG